MGIIREVNDYQVKQLELYTKPANLQKYLGESLDAYTRDCKRTEVIKQILKENK